MGIEKIELKTSVSTRPLTPEEQAKTETNKERIPELIRRSSNIFRAEREAHLKRYDSTGRFPVSIPFKLR
jgi:hypothetical protein